jgi:biotin operon repressor
MSLHNYYERLKFIDSLIRKKATGNPEALAKKLNLSKVATYKLLNELKELGFPIAYSKTEKRYYYSEEGKLVDNLFARVIDDAGKTPRGGGDKYFLKIFSDYTYS